MYIFVYHTHFLAFTMLTVFLKSSVQNTLQLRRTKDVDKSVFLKIVTAKDILLKVVYGAV